MSRVTMSIVLAILIGIGLVGCTSSTAGPSEEPSGTVGPTSLPPTEAATSSPTATPTPAPATILIEEASYQGVIFSAAVAEQQRLHLEASADTDTFWSPSVADVAEMEAQILPALLTDERLSDGIGWRRVRPLEEVLPDYTRQYFGYRTADDEAVIYASFYCNTPVEELTTGWMVVADGGECFFQIHYNVDTDEYFNLRVNGVA